MLNETSIDHSLGSAYDAILLRTMFSRKRFFFLGARWSFSPSLGLLQTGDFSGSEQLQPILPIRESFGDESRAAGPALPITRKCLRVRTVRGGTVTRTTEFMKEAA